MNNYNSRCYAQRNCNNTDFDFMNTASNNNYTNTNAFPQNYLYGHAYTPVQTLSNTYTPEAGLQYGSIFPELISPYSPNQSIDFIEYLRNGGMKNG
jgi:hypothetical protein